MGDGGAWVFADIFFCIVFFRLLQLAMIDTVHQLFSNGPWKTEKNYFLVIGWEQSKKNPGPTPVYIAP